MGLYDDMVKKNYIHPDNIDRDDFDNVVDEVLELMEEEGTSLCELEDILLDSGIELDVLEHILLAVF